MPDLQPYEALHNALCEMNAEPEFPIALDDKAKARIRSIAEEQGVDVYEVIRTFAEESALNYFRGRNDDPANA